ncbi:uncharacterized protein PV09_00225 [Verruconis gallopava]|uniref:Enoyl reductase (ER) domain-containing protein n=1 Tax=Verruconis gallopava TaxID=253628 RepID=A0A0D2ARZ7_9PEZI|nr:uncharacterized protein PV09_00225 [Verruconis gallopava]KIW09310.1 hypothetical protein PV09_00225 [Verruconis gallopava]
MSNKAALLIAAKARPLVIENVPLMKPEKNQILIKSAAVAINPVDWMVQDMGIIIQSYPIVLGEDVAGEVVEVGEEVSRFKPGDRVIAHCIYLVSSKVEHGAFQHYTIAVADLAAKLPSWIPFEEGAVLPLAISTAASGLYTKNFLHLSYPSTDSRPTGRSILVYGASSSVGAVTIQLAIASGLQVVATASSHHHEWIRSLGVFMVLDYKDTEIVEKLISALKSAGEPVGAYDAIGLPSTRHICATVLEQFGGGFIASTLGMENDERLPENVNAGYCFAPAIYTKEPEIAKAVWGEYVPKALENGSLKCKPDPLVMGSGLESIQAALDKHKEGVSGRKVVVSL